MRGKEKMPPTMVSFVWLLLFFTTLAYGFANLGEPCVYDEECETLTTYCRERRVCACKDRYKEEQGRCVATVGARCKSVYDCTTLTNSDCDTEAMQCVCQNGYVRHSSYDKCLPVVSMYKGECEEPTQCKETFGDFADCRPSTFTGVQQLQCRCMDGYHFAEAACYQSRGLGDGCAKDADCSYNEDERNKVYCQGGNGNINSGTCQCRGGFVQSDRVCVDGAAQASISLLALSAMILAKLLLG